MRVLANRGEENRNERHATQRRADHRDPEARRGGIDDGGVMPTARDHGADLLPLEGEVWGMDSSDAKKLKQLEEENRKLKHVVADLTLDNRALKDVLSKNW
jgi:hypothetical protein